MKTSETHYETQFNKRQAFTAAQYWVDGNV